MRYALRDLPALLATPVGRRSVAFGLRRRAWPVVSRLARIYRRTLIRDTRVVAVVGSFGKSTTLRATTAALGGDAERATTRNAWSALANSVLQVRPGQRHAVIEVGIDGPGQMRRYAQVLQPDAVIVTSIGSEHARALGTLGRTRDEKAHMVRALSSDGLAVLNGDDPNVAWMGGATTARIVTFGRGDHNDVVFGDVQLDWPRATRLRVHLGGQSVELRVGLFGWPMMYAITAAVALAGTEGIPLDVIAARLSGLAPTPGRLHPIELANGAILLRDDHKASLESVTAAIDLLEALPAKRKLVVAGSLSDVPGNQRAAYRMLGARLGRIASRIIVVGTSFETYAAGARRAGLASKGLFDAGQSVTRGLDAIREDLRPGDVVLVFGRGSQRMVRVSLGLTGRQVACAVVTCDARPDCPTCPMLERGWEGRRVVI